VRSARRLALLCCALGCLTAAPARAEFVLLSNGQTLKLNGHVVEGDAARLLLKDGGEALVPVSFVQGFVPDEVIDEVVGQGATSNADLRALAVETARRHGLDPALVLAVAGVESAFRPDAVSPKGARGVMQLMPRTAAELGVENPSDPAANLDGGARYLSQMLDLHGGDVSKALAAYNAGPEAVKRHGGVPPYRETREYIRRVIARWRENQRIAALAPNGVTATGAAAKVP
jgi:hypothetical protein